MRVIACAHTITHANQDKTGFVQAMKSLPQYKAAWADIVHAKFSKPHPEFILIDMTELILNWFF